MQDYKQAYEKLLKENTQIFSQNGYWKKQYMDLEIKVKNEMQKIVTLYDTRNNRIIEFLKKSNLPDSDIEQVVQIMPTKVGE